MNLNFTDYVVIIYLLSLLMWILFCFITQKNEKCDITLIFEKNINDITFGFEPHLQFTILNHGSKQTNEQIKNLIKRYGKKNLISFEVKESVEMSENEYKQWIGM